MGLDLALGGLLLISAIRGWLKGFLIQAIRLGGVVAAVYAAAPVRDQARPYVLQYLPTIRADLLDRGLWWVSAVASYVVIVGVASLAVSISRRPTFGVIEPNRGDQFAGLALGLLKGAIVAAFLVAGLERYGVPHLSRIAWADEQMKASVAWDWNARYQPAARIWAAPPVRHFVQHIHRMGWMSPGDAPAGENTGEKPMQTASRTPALNAHEDADAN